VKCRIQNTNESITEAACVEHENQNVGQSSDTADISTVLEPLQFDLPLKLLGYLPEIKKKKTDS
jgi:hypothetical protein